MMERSVFFFQMKLKTVMKAARNSGPPKGYEVKDTPLKQ